MPAKDGGGPRDDPAWSPGWKFLALAVATYSACVVVATYPRITTVRTQLPGLSDALTHLWTLRWNRASLLEGHSPFFNPDIQAPVGSPIGLVPPMHLQTFAYLAASAITRNDILIYNAIWFASFVGTGVGTAWLAWFVARDRASALLAGLLAMLATPMMTHGFGHLELIQVGGFPLFLVAWLRLVDRPDRRRLLAAAGLYLIVAMSAPYFAIFAVFPAVLYAAWSLAGAIRAGSSREWCRDRLRPAAVFAVLAGSGLAVLYSGQLWAAGHGFAVTRPRAEFLKYGVPPWAYLAPTPLHALGKLLPTDPYQAAGMGETTGERASYLGAVTILLLAYAAVARVRFARASYWWATLGLLVVLSFGATWRVGGVKLSLPASWGLDSFSPLRLIRVPARFNLFAGVIAAVIAAAALKNLLARLRWPSARVAAVAALMAASLADLAIVPFGSAPIPPMPACYAAMREMAPGASFAEGPQYASSDSVELSALGAYWQSFHKGRTTAGYTAHPNLAFDHEIAHASPFSVWDLASPYFLSDPGDESVDLIRHVSYRDYVWLYLTHHGLRFAVLHKRPMAVSGHPVQLDRAREALREGLVFEDADTIVFDRDRLAPPTRPVALCVTGWRRTAILEGRRVRPVAIVGRLSVFNPDPARDLTIALDASAFRRPRRIRVESDSGEVARWTIEPGAIRTVASPPFRLGPGLSDLTITSDGDDRPSRHRDEPPDGDRRPISLNVAAIHLRAMPPAPTSDQRGEVAAGSTGAGAGVDRVPTRK